MPDNNSNTSDRLELPSAEAIMALLAENVGYIFSEKELAARFRISRRADLLDFAEELDGLITQDKILYLTGKHGGFTSMLSAKEVEGKIDYASVKRAFCVVDSEAEDISIFPENLNTAMHNDRVRLRFIPKYDGTKPDGRVVEVIERARDEFVGTYRFHGRRAVVEPEMKRVWTPIVVKDGAVAATEGDKVTIKVFDWGDAHQPPSGEIIANLGASGTHNAEMQGIMAEFGLPTIYPEDANQESEEMSDVISEAEIALRRDFRGTTTFTIDPVDAKDFDDALSIKDMGDGLWEIGVHIADVTHYVQQGTALEGEARRRATSIYLVDRVVPMLPERLSNGLCSLRPNEDKLTYSAVFVLDTKGKIRSEWFGRTIIHSDHRFSYESAQEVLDGQAEGPFKAELLKMNEIAYALREDRFKKGAISFETVEVRFVLDEHGRPLRVVPKVRQDTNKMIEDYMLLANKQVAEFVFNMGKGKSKPTMVYRVHESPDAQKIADLATFVKKFGLHLDAGSEQLSVELNRLSKEAESKPEAQIIAQYAIRSMQKARYTIMPLGHFGLGYKHYSHFTSPIRRYPDMMAHRLLTRYLKPDAEPAEPTGLEALCKQSSEMEKRAADAERASIKYKQVEFMLARLGEEFDAVISGLTEWGLYAEITETACEGMIRLADIPDDHYVYDPDKLITTGRRTGRRFVFGDKIKIRVREGNLLKRTLDLEMVIEGYKAGAKAEGAQDRRGGSVRGSARGSGGRNSQRAGSSGTGGSSNSSGGGSGGGGFGQTSSGSKAGGNRNGGGGSGGKRRR